MKTALAFADLPDVDAVLSKTEADDELFRELAEVLKRHNALDRFGITLLQTHFLSRTVSSRSLPILVACSRYAPHVPIFLSSLIIQ